MTRRHGKRPGPAVFVGENMIARATGHTYEARPMAKLPVKVPGRHRWIVSAAWTVSESTIERIGPGAEQYMDHENLMTVGIGCFDCEQILGEIGPGSFCPGDPSGVDR